MLERTHDDLQNDVAVIAAEFLGGFQMVLEIDRPAVSIFGSARVDEDSAPYLQARATAKLFAEAHFAVVTGGGPGVMEAANRGAKLAGGRSIGCNIELPFEQGANPYVDTLINFRYFFVRKTMFIKYSNAFIIFPGGFGTLDEAFEALTLIQTDKVLDFPVVLFDSDYWRELLDWIDGELLADGMVSPEDVELLHVTDDPAEAVRLVVESYDQRNAAQ